MGTSYTNLQRKLVPTAYTRYVRRDTEAPARVLQVWWTTIVAAECHTVPETVGIPGEWRDVPVYETQPETP